MRTWYKALAIPRSITILKGGVPMEYMGFDYRKQYSFVTSIDSESGEVRQARLANTPESIGSFIRDSSRTCAVLEASRTWSVLYELLKDRVADVKLAHPYQVKAIASARIKTDKIDSATLAHLLAADLIPEAHIRQGGNRQNQIVLRQRAFFVASRTRVKNRIHYLIDRQTQAVSAAVRGVTDLFGKAGMAWLRETQELTGSDRILLDQMLDLYDCLTSLLNQSNAMIKELFQNDPDAQRLESIPGIGLFLATIISTEIDGIERFATAKKLEAYTGLVPSTYASGGSVRHGKIIKQGNKWLRWAFVEAAHTAKRYNAQFNAFHNQRKVRIGVNKATVALARRIATIAFKVLKEQRVFEQYRTPNIYANAS